jgi:hypothetical protein
MRYFEYYRYRRPHVSLEYLTPGELVAGRVEACDQVCGNCTKFSREKNLVTKRNPERGSAAAAARDLGRVSRAACILH